jgi:hypothetical protein
MRAFSSISITDQDRHAKRRPLLLPIRARKEKIAKREDLHTKVRATLEPIQQVAGTIVAWPDRSVDFCDQGSGFLPNDDSSLAQNLEKWGRVE